MFTNTHGSCLCSTGAWCGVAIGNKSALNVGHETPSLALAVFSLIHTASLTIGTTQQTDSATKTGFLENGA